MKSAWGYFCTVPVGQMGLSLTYGHAAGVQRDDLVIKASPAGLMLGYELWLKATFTVTRNIDGSFAKLALEGLLAFTIARVATGIANHCVFIMAKMVSHLSLQGAFDECFGELFEQTVLTNQVFWLFIVR
jgi:hypothetical protein